ncbi:hypothetical protein D3C81_1730530 [compost metagenome]
MHLPAKTITTIVNPLVVPWRLIFKLTHRHKLLQHAISNIFIGLRIFIIYSQTPGQHIPADLRFITMAVYNTFQSVKWRPPHLHIHDQPLKVFPHLTFNNGIHQWITPIIDQRPCIDRPSQFTGNITMCYIPKFQN